MVINIILDLHMDIIESMAALTAQPRIGPQVCDAAFVADGLQQ